MISDTIAKLLMDAMKSKDSVRVSTLRMLSSALNYEKIAKQHDLSIEEEMVVLRREIKRRKDAILAYEKANAFDKAQQEQKELEVLKEFLPQEINDPELELIVKKVIAENGFCGIKDMGKTIALVKDKVGLSADGARIAEIVRKLLASAS